MSYKTACKHKCQHYSKVAHVPDPIPRVPIEVSHPPSPVAELPIVLLWLSYTPTTPSHSSARSVVTENSWKTGPLGVLFMRYV